MIEDCNQANNIELNFNIIPCCIKHLILMHHISEEYLLSNEFYIFLFKTFKYFYDKSNSILKTNFQEGGTIFKNFISMISKTIAHFYFKNKIKISKFFCKVALNVMNSAELKKKKIKSNELNIIKSNLVCIYNKGNNFSKSSNIAKDLYENNKIINNDNLIYLNNYICSAIKDVNNIDKFFFDKIILYKSLINKKINELILAKKSNTKINSNNTMVNETNLNMFTPNEENKSVKVVKGNIYKTINREYVNNKGAKISLEDFVYSNLFKGEPGPGYYQRPSDFDKYYSNNNNRFNFGSNCDREVNKPIPGNRNLGPGRYFRTTKAAKFVPDFHPFSRKEETINLKKYEKDLINELIGPGKYDIKSQFDKTQIYYSGSLEKRFFDNIKIIKPGPGEYLPLDNWTKSININQNIKNLINNCKKIDKEKVDINKTNRHSYIQQNSYPGVGDYNPHIVSSIQYDIISKDNKVSNLIAPFQSGQEKFFKKSASTSNLLSPGYYFINNNIQKRNKVDSEVNKLYKNGFLYKDNNIKENYSHMKLNYQNKLGPGAYYLNNYNDWNKRSFNYLFV